MIGFVSIEVGDRVTGRYYGGEFAGHVVGVRAHSIRWDVREVRVELDAPTVFPIGGGARERVLIYDDWSGRPAEGFGDSSSGVDSVNGQGVGS